MAKILSLGIGPLLEPNARIFGAHALRTWQMTAPLLAAGHEVALFTLPGATDRPEEQARAGVAGKQHEGFAYRMFLNNDEANNFAALREFAGAFRPDALLGINCYPASMLARLGLDAPLWADFYGSILYEGAVKSAVHRNNSEMDRYWNVERDSLARADKFSTVSHAQSHSIVGQLAALGRINRHTFEYAFAHRIDCAFDPSFADPPASGAQSPIYLHGSRGSDFVVLWSGAFNAWTNVDVLADALELAIAARGGIEFVSTGGAVYGHDEFTYARFEERALKSKYRESIRLLGWIESSALPAIYHRQADVGLNADFMHVETVFGTRTRIPNMMVAGLPVLTTLGTELSREVVAAGVALGCAPGDSKSLAEAMVAAYDRRTELPELGQRARAFAIENYSFEATTRSLVEWMRDPRPAPDRVAGWPARNVREREGTPTPENAQVESGAETPVTEKIKRGVEAVVGKRAYGKLREMKQRLKPADASASQDANVISVSSLGSKLYFTNEDAGRLSSLDAMLKAAREANASTIELHVQKTHAAQLDAVAGALLEEGFERVIFSLPVRGLETSHNRASGSDRAWVELLTALERFKEYHRRHPARFQFRARIALAPENAGELEELKRFLTETYACEIAIENGSPG